MVCHTSHASIVHEHIAPCVDILHAYHAGATTDTKYTCVCDVMSHNLSPATSTPPAYPWTVVEEGQPLESCGGRDGVFIHKHTLTDGPPAVVFMAFIPALGAALADGAIRLDVLPAGNRAGTRANLMCHHHECPAQCLVQSAVRIVMSETVWSTGVDSGR